MGRRARFLALVMAVLVLTVSPALVATASDCTRVIGGSQTTNWYSNGSYETLVPTALWELQARGGQSIEKWGIGGTGWSTRLRSPCTPQGTVATRLVIHILPAHTVETVEGISAHIAAAIAAVPTYLPSVTRITLVPPVSGPGCDTVTLSRVQPATVEAINQNLSEIVDPGPAVVLPSCSMFRDNAGHLTAEGARYAAGQFAALLP